MSMFSQSTTMLPLTRMGAAFQAKSLTTSEAVQCLGEAECKDEYVIERKKYLFGKAVVKWYNC